MYILYYTPLFDSVGHCAIWSPLGRIATIPRSDRTTGDVIIRQTYTLCSALFLRVRPVLTGSNSPLARTNRQNHDRTTREWLTSKEAIGDKHHVDADREAADDEEQRSDDAARHCHCAASELVGQRTHHWSWHYRKSRWYAQLVHNTVKDK